MVNRPFLSCPLSHFQNQSSCKSIQTNENEFDLHENGRAGETYFYMNVFAQTSLF